MCDVITFENRGKIRTESGAMRGPHLIIQTSIWILSEVDLLLFIT